MLYIDLFLRSLDSVALPLYEASTERIPLTLCRLIVLCLLYVVLRWTYRWLVSSTIIKRGLDGVDITAPPLVTLLGPSGGGKTALYYLLTLGEERMTETVPSLSKNRRILKMRMPEDPRSGGGSGGPYSGAEYQVDLVDYPGHGRVKPGAISLAHSVAVRNNVVSSHQRGASSTKLGRGAVVVVADSSDKSSVKSAAELIYDILCDDAVGDITFDNSFIEDDNDNEGVVGDTEKETEREYIGETESDAGSAQDRRLRVLVVCNQQDKSGARRCTDMRQQLERTIEILRRSDSNENPSAFSSFTKANELFTFKKSSIRTALVQCSVLRREVSVVRRFLCQVGQPAKNR